MLGFNGGTIGIANTVFIGTKSNDPNYSSVSLLLNGNETSGSDPNYSSVSLLLNGNTTFTDSSSYGHTVTANGDAQISTTQSKFGGASMYFDGSGDYINCPASTAFSFGTGDFTIEFFARWNSFSDVNVLVDTRTGGASSTGLVIFTDADGTIAVYSGVTIFITGSALQVNQWYFVALSRASGTTRLFIDGVQSGASASDTRNYTDQNFFAGRTNESAINYFSGYIDDLRITKGVARYTSNFTPPTAQLPDFGNTITDSSSYGHTVTANGNAQISTTQSKFGGASMYFDGSGDYLSLANSEDWNFASGNFTVEAFIYPLSFADEPMIVGQWSGDLGGTGLNWALMFDSSSNGYLRLITSSDGSSVLFDLSTSTYSLTLNKWSHIAAVRNGNTFTLYVDGISRATTINSSSLYNATNLLTIGSESSSIVQYFNGYIDDLRVTKGIARYTSNFTPPTAQLPGGETGTFASGLWTSSDHIKQIRNELWPGLIVTDGLVLHLDAGDSASYPGSGTTWTDLSGNGNNGTISGATYDSANGGSLSFDGNNDYVQLPTTTLLRASSTISAWINIDDFTTGKTSTGRVFIKNTGNNFNSLIGFYNGGYSFEVDTNSNPHEMSGRTTGNVSSSAISAGSWFHFSLVFESNTFYGYVNGVLTGSDSLDDNLTFNRIGDGSGFPDSYPAYMKGKIANFKVYNRPLTPSEVTQNYNALKGRYGL